jgi:hypothetical protein
MSKDRKYETLSLEDLGEDERLVLEIVMREGALRFQEQVVKNLYRLKRTVKSNREALGIQKSIDAVYEHELDLD